MSSLIRRLLSPKSEVSMRTFHAVADGPTALRMSNVLFLSKVTTNKWYFDVRSTAVKIRWLNLKKKLKPEESNEVLWRNLCGTNSDSKRRIEVDCLIPNFF